MKKQLRNYIKLFLFLLTTLNFCFFADAQEHQWTTGGGSPFTSPPGYNAQERVFDLTTDEHGNLYVVAELMAMDSIRIDTITFPIKSPSIKTWRPKSALLSYNREGRIRWGKILEGDNGTIFSALVYDDKGGVYIAGKSGGTKSALRYFGDDTTVSSTNAASWLLKYDTLGNLQWVQSQGDNTNLSAEALGSFYGKLLMQDSLIHLVKEVRRSGVTLMPGVVSKRGIYEFVYTPSGELLEAKRLPLQDSMLGLNIALPPSIHQPSQTLYLSAFKYPVSPDDTISIPSGVAVFDRDRNLMSFDTFSTTGKLNAGNIFIGFRDGDYQYYFGYFVGSDCTFKGQTFIKTFPNLLGSFSFMMKMDLKDSLIWKQQINNVKSTAGGIRTIYAGLVKGNIIATGITTSLVIEKDTLVIPPAGIVKIPILMMDSTGTFQHMDFWRDRDYTPSSNRGMFLTSDTAGNIFVGGTMTDSIWGGNSGYMSKGGPADFFVSKYGYKPNCAPPLSSYTYDTSALRGQPVAFTFTGTTSGIDSIAWAFGDGSLSHLHHPVHTFDSGRYRVCATVYNDCGPTRHCKSITIRCPEVAASFTYSLIDKSLSLSYSGSTPVDSVLWDFGDGTQASGLAPVHDYVRGGNYEVCVIAFRDCGIDTFCLPVAIFCALPRATFDYHATSDKTLELTYTGSRPVDSVLWDFGDGNSSQGESLSHSFPEEGSYRICVRAYNECGVDTFCRTAKVTGSSAIPEPSAKAEEIVIYPNPAAEYLIIEGGYAGVDIEVFDVLGRRQLRYSLKSSLEQLTIRDWPSGVYLIRMEAEGKLLHSRRLVVAH